jgi:LmbE family N-acetylglucosaminyl deacetylase
MKIVVVSPHLDDAALSASASIGQHDATVLTVFSALPAPDLPVTSWDRLTGATSSQQRQRERIAEDEVAMAALGATGVHLGEREILYRDGDPDLAAAVRRMAEAFSAADAVWLPAAVGGNPDHVLAREAGLRAMRAAGRADVVLYADFPYVIAYGWPTWATGRPADPHLDPDFWLEHELASAGFDRRSLSPHVVTLSQSQRALKAQVIAAYRSQAAALQLTPQNLAANPSKLDYELFWDMTLPR